MNLLGPRATTAKGVRDVDRSRRVPIRYWYPLCAGLAARVAYVVVTHARSLRGDAVQYHATAVSVVNGGGYLPSIAPAGGASAFRPPLYPLSVAGVYELFGVRVTAVLLLQALLGTVSIALLGHLTWRLVGPHTALVSMWIGALYPAFIFSGGILMTESFALALQLAALSLALEARRSSRPMPWLLGLGVALGLSVLNRPNTAVLVIPLALLATPPAQLRRLLRQAVIVGATAVLVTVPWLVRNVVVFDSFVPVTTQSGPVMLGTYNDVSANDPDHPALWRPPLLVPAGHQVLDEHRTAGEVELADAMRDEALAYIGDHPTYPLEVALWNTVRLFDLTGPSFARLPAESIGMGTAETYVWLGGWYLLAGAALWGIAVLRRKRTEVGDPGIPRVLWSIPPLLVASIVLLHGFSRLRIGIEVFAIVLAAIAIERALPARSPRRHADDRTTTVEAEHPGDQDEPPVTDSTFVLGYQPALDGMRAIAIGLVMLYHLNTKVFERAGPAPGGILGVDVFFVLSGFLITSLLLQERRRTGAISMRSFYWRRALRLFPALWALLAVHAIATVAAGGDVREEFRAVVGAVSYVTNWITAAGQPMPSDLLHLWSLAIEEQFYLFWPPLLALLLRRRPRWLLPAMATIVVAATVSRVLGTMASTTPIPVTYVQTHARLGAIMVGAVLAWALHAGMRVPRRMAVTGGWIGLVVLLVLAAEASIASRWLYWWGYDVAALASLLLVVAALEPGHLLSRLLADRRMVWVGMLSYSLYLWHLPVFELIGQNRPGNGVAAATAATAAALAAALMSNRWVERPFLRLKDHAQLRSTEPAHTATTVPPPDAAPGPTVEAPA